MISARLAPMPRGSDASHRRALSLMLVVQRCFQFGVYLLFLSGLFTGCVRTMSIKHADHGSKQPGKAQDQLRRTLEEMQDFFAESMLGSANGRPPEQPTTDALFAVGSATDYEIRPIVRSRAIKSQIVDATNTRKANRSQKNQLSSRISLDQLEQSRHGVRHRKQQERAKRPVKRLNDESSYTEDYLADVENGDDEPLDGGDEFVDGDSAGISNGGQRQQLKIEATVLKPAIDASARRANAKMFTSSAATASFDDLFQRHGSPHQSECPRRSGKPLMPCPSRHSRGYVICISDRDLCDGVAQCPGREDEDATSCLFYKMFHRYFKMVMDTLTELSDVVSATHSEL